MQGKVSAYILADHRENTGAIPHLPSDVAENNRNTNLPWKTGGGELIFQVVNNATIGDYAIMVPSLHDPSKNILAAVFERKTWKDLAASLKDQRFVNQHKNMIQLREQKGCMLYYIIEGGLTYQDTTKIARIPFKNLHAKVRSMSLTGVHSFQTKDQQDTSRLLINLARDISRLYRNERLDFPQQELKIMGAQEQTPIQILNMQIYKAMVEYKKSITDNDDPILQSLQNIVEMTTIDDPPEMEESAESTETDIPISLDIPQELTTRPKKENDDIIMNMWCALPNVSAKSAPVLMKNIDILDVLTVSEWDVSKLTDKITHLTYATGNKFGRQRAEKIMQIGYHGDDTNRLKIRKDLSAKVLAQIPGLTIDKANLMLDKYSLEDIISGVYEYEIADIKFKNRRLGNKIAQRVSSIFE